MDMKTAQNGEAQALFQQIRQDGSRCLFVILTSGGWAITCNGTQMSVGTGEPRSIIAGVEQFKSLTVPAAGAYWATQRGAQTAVA